MQEITKLETNAVTSMSDFVEIKDEQVYTTSRIVAEKFGKDHFNVIQSIEELIRTMTQPIENIRELKNQFSENKAQPIENIREVNFDFSKYFIPDEYKIEGQTRTYKQYLITEEGTMLLIMGFTGEKALSVKLKFISEFKRMKEYIRTLEANPIERILANSTNQLETARAITQMLEIEAKKQEVLIAQNKQLTTTINFKDQQLAESEPKVQYCDIVLNCKDVVPITYIAKDYGKSSMWLNQFLKDKGIQYKSGDIWLLYQKYAELGLTKSKTTTFEDKNGNKHTKMHTYWTQKGRLFIYDLLKQGNIFPLIEQE